ncbi:MAG: phytanoyl-CoA dioxygenase family protein [Alphaproteobacteria bacterium]|nr:phytanoyl-CoA dioxygenase family protein [Alphaproteobacteria bacterium]
MSQRRVLIDGDIAAFHRDGFVVKRGLFDADELADIARWTDEVASAPERPDRQWMYFEDSLIAGGGRILNRIENFYPFHDGLRQLMDGPKLKGAMAELLGEPAVLYKEKINLKLPGGDGFKPHQDQQAGWGKYADFFITALVSVDEATEENGCLELAAGRHKEGIIGEEWVPIGEHEWQAMGIRPYPTKPGDVVFFDCYAPHGSGPNLSDAARRVLYVTYNRASAGDHRAQYYADKFESYPPDIARNPNKEYVFRV